MSIHVAILLPPYIRLILAGRKTVESRLTQRPLPPYRTIQPGERIYFKASSGTFQATARAADVTCYDNLTPTQILVLQKRHNAAVCGEARYWQGKRHSRYATFITLREVAPTAIGPAIAPSSGLAWFTLPDSADPAPTTSATTSPIIDIPLTAGALRNHYLRLPQLAPGPIQLTLPDACVIASELNARKMVRWRRWGPYFAAHALKPGDLVRLVPIADRQYRVCFVRHAPR